MVRALSAMVAVLGGVLVVVPGGWLVLTVGSGEHLSRVLVGLLVLGVFLLSAVFAVRFETQARARNQKTWGQMQSRFHQKNPPPPE